MAHSQIPSVPAALRGGSLADRLRAFLKPARPSQPDIWPVTIGEPPPVAGMDDALGYSRWTTQARVSADGGTRGPLTVRAASVCGSQHASQGESREDAFAFEHTPDGTVVVAVADGVGSPSAQFSAVGARVASLLSCQLIRGALEAGQAIDPQAACAELAAGMVTAALPFLRVTFGKDALATTLITVWVSPRGKYRGFMVGDGGVFELNAGRVTEVIRPKAGFAGETEALPVAYTEVKDFSGFLAAGSAVLLATDGLAIPLASPDVAQAIGEGWQQPPSILRFLYDMSFERRGAWDDRTGIGVWFGPDREPGPEETPGQERAAL